jgi:hypothetical protein
MWENALQDAAAGKVLVRKNRAAQCGLVVTTPASTAATPASTAATPASTAANDVDFLARVQCFREAGARILQNKEQRAVLKTAFKSIVACVLVEGGADPTMCLDAIDGMEEYVLAEMENDGGAKLLAEMQARGIPVLSLYDLGLEFFLFDCFDLMENPPRSVTMVTGNRWIAQSARQYATRNAIKLVMEQRIKNCADGTFLKVFYSIVVQLNPLLISGLLGAADTEYVALCRTFKMATSAWVAESFAILGQSDADTLDPHLYAEKIVQAAARWMSLQAIEAELGRPLRK